MKKPSFAPAYLTLYPFMAEIANKFGYALTIHGSLNRDFDLVAIPWVEEADNPIKLLAEIQAFVDTIIQPVANNVPETKPHGRIAYTINLQAGAYIDISIMPRDKK